MLPYPVTTGVEVGVARGASSAVLLRHLPKLHLTMVDAWQPYPTDPKNEKSKDGLRKYNAQEMALMHADAVKATEPYADRRTIWHMTSKNAAKKAGTVQYDFIFLDGDHSEAGVRDDIRLWWPRVKHGGILCGHDFASRRLRGVQRAVLPFVEEEHLPLYVAPYKIWWVRKWENS